MNRVYYSNYNSIISQGQRVRRMRRTQLSADKIVCLNQTKKNNSYSKPFTSYRAKSCRSLPKVQRSYNYQRQNTTEEEKIVGVQHEYYMGGKTSFHQHKQCSLTIENHFYRKGANREVTNMKASTQPHNVPSSDQLFQSNEKQSEKISSVEKKKSLNNSKFQSSLNKKSKMKNQSLPSKKPTQILHDNYGLEENLKGQSYNPSSMSQEQFCVGKQSSVNEKKSKFHKKNSKLKLSKASYRKEDNYEMGKKLSKEIFVDDLSNPSSIQNESLKSKSKIMLNSKTSFLRRSSKEESFSQSKISKVKLNSAEESSVSASLSSHQNQYSKLEPHGGSILAINQRKKTQSWKDTIKSLGSVSILNQMKDSGIKKNQQRPTLDKRMSLKLESIRKQNKVGGETQRDHATSHHEKMRTSFRNLPLTSREPSQRRSIDKPMGNSLEEVFQRIQIHQYIVTLLNDFKETTIDFYYEEEQQCEKLCFLLERKHFFEKNNMVKALKGGKNIFNLSSIEIPNEILHLHLDHPQIKNLIKQYEQSNRVLFKNLEKSFRELKKRFKNDPHIKLETPVDNFSKFIVDQLHEQLKVLYPSLENDNLSEEDTERYQDRIIEIIQKIFVLSQFAGRKVKKLEFIDEIEDFDAYYQENFENLMATIDYFQQIN